MNVRIPIRLFVLVVLVFSGSLVIPPFVQGQEVESIIDLTAEEVGVGNDMFQRAYGGRLLSISARFHSGDDPTWADPDYDDSEWERNVDTWIPTDALPEQGWSGIGWFRFRMRLDPALNNRQTGFTFHHLGALEVFLDGERVYESGIVGATSAEEKPSQDVSPVTLPLEGGVEHLIAVRYSAARFNDTVAAQWLGGSGWRMYWGDLSVMRENQSISRLNEGLYIGFFLAFSLLFGLLFLLYREERLFLYCALLYGSWAPAVLMISELPFMQGTSVIMPLWGFWSALVVGGSLALLRLIYAFFYEKLPRMFYGFLIAGVAALALVVYRFENTPYISLYFVPLFIEVLRTVITAIWRRKKWAWIVGLGFLPIIVMGSMDMFNELGWMEAPWAGSTLEPGMIVMFFLTASLSVYVGIRFAEANRGLVRANRELTEVNRGLDEANRTLEERVQERTAKLRASQAQLVQAEKLASLGQLTAGIAHEIRNPLNFVCNFARINEEMVQELSDEMQSNRNRLDTIADQMATTISEIKVNSASIAKHGEQADLIVSNMIEHASASKGARAMVQVNHFVEEYVDIAYNGLKTRIPDLDVTIEKSLDEETGSVMMSRQEMGKVLMNVMNNAFEAVHERAKTDGLLPWVHVSAKRENGTVEIRVRDNGPGIPDNDKDKLFEPFYTTKPPGNGNTGLGLSLAHDIVVQGHAGSLTVESTEGHGATFIITLPDSVE